ncbi:geranylgeranylglyceryl/heptaprenylglyceryl phosphate synthase [Pontibacter sp. G13]|uniref:geranylgeranylglyceryl/heptaprenylglyceryl phosphate synthase n=1 Tax=Pontibacter sp. G13 TaxID=3074898 RepID=UPI0028890D7B|nr:geranylgeranylglyceryl/heptaprenylglyceryl phosphate synthase [Pontibacter sp. G13]WNJ16144.1 geranylgeranylglyceryl/heptaprenylglyceryl phosphate synthase [Pontibacter sp. G13]
MNQLLRQTFASLKSSGRKAIALLLDPDKTSELEAFRVIELAEAHGVDFLLVGGSLTVDASIHTLVPAMKSRTKLPIILFPGSPTQITPSADGILFLSLISGRNPDLLIGRHVEAAPLLKGSGIEVLPTGYMLIDTGKPTTANYISNTQPIPHNKPEIALCTAIAGELLGLHQIYMDGGSGADSSISTEMIHAVSSRIDIPLIIGGGIRTQEDAMRIWHAGADVIVVGTALESDPSGSFIRDLGAAKSQIHAQSEMEFPQI